VRRIQERLAEVDRIIQTQPSYITVYGSDHAGEIRRAVYRDELQVVFQAVAVGSPLFPRTPSRFCLPRLESASLQPRVCRSYCYGLGGFDTILYCIIRLLLAAMIRMSPEGELMAELSAGLGLSNIGTTIREIQGFTSTAMYCTGFESLYTAHEVARPARDCAYRACHGS
jgi:hypothetical protein